MPYSTAPSPGTEVASVTASASCWASGGIPGSGSRGVATTARAPVRPTAAPIRSGEKYISRLVVTPPRSISAEAAVIATATSPGVSRRSRGQIPSRSQRASGNPSAWPRNSTIGACEWAFTSPGSSTPGTATTSASPTSGASAAGPTQVNVPSSTSTAASGTTVPARSPTTTARAVKRCRMGGEPTPAAAGCRPACAVTVGRMSYLAAAASSDQGGITGFLLDVVERLGAIGVGFAILLETVVPPIPSEAVLGLAGVLINDGRLSIVPVVLCATLGSIVRSFISVPAGVVRMPLPQFVLYTAGGSLIWNSVLIGLGVAAGDFVQQNLHYLDYAVVAAFVLGIGYLVHKRWRDVRRHREARSADPDESRSA